MHSRGLSNFQYFVVPGQARDDGLWVENTHVGSAFGQTLFERVVSDTERMIIE